MQKLDDILKKGHQMGASDIHLVAGSTPIYRVNGSLIFKEERQLMPNDTAAMAQGILTEELWEVLTKQREVDLSYGIDGVSRFRVNIFYQRSSISLAFRVIPRAIPSIEELGIPHQLKKIVEIPHGIFLVTGPTGSGKSSSLAAMIDHINETMNLHVVTLEDPIEYLHTHKKSIIAQREVGFDTLSFKNGLRACLRQDPDVILVGELRDRETIETAITAAETGHLVLGTLHTQDTAGTIDRIIDVFPSHNRNEMRKTLANVLIGVMSQRLFPKIDRSGRVVATEMLINTPAIQNLIRTEKMHQIPNVLQTGKSQGMHTMEMSIQELVNQNLINSVELAPYKINTRFKS